MSDWIIKTKQIIMAELHVQPKKASNWWIWLLLALIVIGVIYFLTRGSNTTATGQDSAKSQSAGDSSASASGVVATTTPTTNPPKLANGDVDFNAPAANYDEIKDKDITVRGTGGYAIYSLGGNILFDVDKSTIRADAASKLRQITASLGKRYADGEIAVYGYADTSGDQSHNKQLSEQRAESVKNWLVKNAGLSQDHITLHPMGESNPVATNATEQGKRENRSVQIVARKRGE
jgi:outer membrane protein OmpA-like peptidoglycan-associated protein